MKMKQVKGAGIRNHVLIGMGVVLFLTLIQIISPVSADDSITAYCYRGGSSLSLGNVLIFDISTAARACNNVYYDCKGKCIGCFHDFDYVDYVCVDKSGRTFLR
jgi:hypothetical protein